MRGQITDITNQFSKYIISGGVGAGIDFILFFMLVTYANQEFILSNIISFSIGTIIVCYLQKQWTFRYTSSQPISFLLKYFVSIGLVFLLNNILLILFIRFLGINQIMAKFFQIIICSVFGYSIQKIFVFR